MMSPAGTRRTMRLLWWMCLARTARVWAWPKPPRPTIGCSLMTGMKDLLWSMSVQGALTGVKSHDWMVTEVEELEGILNPGNQLPGGPWSVDPHRCSGSSHRRLRGSHRNGRQLSGGSGLAGQEVSRPCMTKPYGAATSECRGWRRDSLPGPGDSEQRGCPVAPPPASG